MEGSVKMPYEAPRLFVFGEVEHLTRDGGPHYPPKAKNIFRVGDPLGGLKSGGDMFPGEPEDPFGS